MRKLYLIGLTVLSFSMLYAQDQLTDFSANRATVYKSSAGKSLTSPSSQAPAKVVSDFMRGHGVSPAALESLHITAQGASARGLTRVQMEQVVAGLRVEGAYVKASVNAQGELVHLIQNIAPMMAVQPVHVTEAQALRAAVSNLYPKFNESLVPTSRSGNTTYFSKGAFFYSAPSVERVAYLTKAGELKAGYLVETWSGKANLLHETLVDGNGRVASVELRTDNDHYNVFTVNPNVTPQAIVAGPGAGNSQSPIGWLFARTQSTVSIAGNNVHAYLDTDNNNAPDPGGTPVTNGDFLTGADLTATPSTDSNKNVAVQNLFYLNNVLHDTLYIHGFTEVTGNFQEDNFGKGGLGGDSVNAEGQDGGGTDNANFATPVDGRNPRMQMYLWTGKGDHQVVVDAPPGAAGTYLAQGADFGPALDATGLTANISLVNDGTGTTTDACEALTAGSLTGQIALIDRGTCAFVIKVKNVQNAGAIAAIVANNANGDSIITMGGTDSTITIPSVFISQNSGTTLKANLTGLHGTVRLTDPPPLQRDGDVDSDVVYHEYGHGLTWRMIGKMSGPMSGAIGEGMSDVLADTLNNDDRVGEYVFSDPLGIRTAPYTNYPRTYGDVAGTEVHFDGEVYGAIGWLLLKNYQGAGLTASDMLDDVVDGMNFTPKGPAFEDMRDGILQSIANSTHPDRECLVWTAFAHYGVGVGAKGVVHGKKVVVTESFVLPPECQ